MASRATGVTDALHSSSRAEVAEEDHSEHQPEEVREMGDKRGQESLEVVVPITREAGVDRADIRDIGASRCMLSAQLRTQRGTLSMMMLRLPTLLQM